MQKNGHSGGCLSVQRWRKKFTVMVASIASAGMFLAAMPAVAVEFNMGPVTGTVDATMGYAAGVRLGDPVSKADLDNITMRDWTFDKGDIYTNAFKLTPELELKYENYGLFARVTGFWDTVIDQGGSGRANYLFDQGDGDGWSDDAGDEIGLGYELYDLYLYSSYDVENFLGMGYSPIDLRIGNQAFNWGEGSFYLDGINTTNALDFNKLSLPGAEIKEATIAVPAALAQIGLGDNTSIDAYYQFGWSETKLPPAGTFFGDSTDVFGMGGRALIVHDGFGGALPLVNRLGDIDAKDDGQFGLAVHHTLGDFELGAYYVNYHSQVPLVRFTEPDTTDVDEYLADNAFQFIYPENISMFGTSVATTAMGWAIAAEVTYRPEAQLMKVDPGVFVGGQIDNLFTNGAGTSWGGTRAGTVNPGDTVDLVEERELWHAQINLMKQLGAGMSFDTTWLFLTAAMDHLPGDRSGLGSFSAGGVDPDSVAWGYSIDIDSTWFNLLPGVDVSPGISWMHGVDGYSHFWGNWWEGRKSVQARVNVDVGKDWSYNLNYNQVFNDEDEYAENGTNANFSVSYNF